MDTERIERPGLPGAWQVRALTVRVLSGPDAGADARPDDGRVLRVGAAPVGNTLTLRDRTVSRYHLELVAGPRSVVVRDVGSTNGSWLGPVRFKELEASETLDVRVGETVLRVELLDGARTVETHAGLGFGELIGRSAAMRAVFARLERAARSNLPILITGESGTGKELTAHAIHAHSRRATRPFEVIDCAALAGSLAERELFGHEKGSYTGADTTQPGPFERADGGTVFLDEIGELDRAVQQKLLRVLNEGEVRRVGAARSRKVDVRVIAATNRNLREEVNADRFREDLYYRLAVVEVEMPPLRERLDDLDDLIESLLARIRREEGTTDALALDRASRDALCEHTWPGNVRELYNALRRLVALGEVTTIPRSTPPPPMPSGDEPPLRSDDLWALPWHEARQTLEGRFQRAYLGRMLDRTGNNISAAARLSGIDRVSFDRALQRNGLKPRK